MRQAFGIFDGRTLSVVDDIARKSPVIIERTTSIGVRIDSEKENLPRLVNDGSQRIGEDALERHPALAHGRNDAAQSWRGQHDAGRRFGNVSCRRYGYSNLRLPQCRSIVGAVAAHANNMAGLLIEFHQPIFVFGQDAGKDRKVPRAGTLGDCARRTDRALQADCTRYDRGCGGRVPSHHHSAHTHLAQRGNQGCGIGTRRIAQRDQSGELHRARRAHRDTENPVALGLEFVRSSGGQRRLSRQCGNHREGPLGDPDFGAVRLDRGRLRHFRCGIERHERDKRRQTRIDATPGRGANGRVDRVLTALGARERRQCQDARLV
jgi:hypothetical protein